MATHIPSFQTRHHNRLAVPFAARWSSADHPGLHTGLHIPAPQEPPPPVCGAGCCSALRPPPPPTTARVPRSSPVDSAAQALLLYTFCHKPTHPPESLLLYQPRTLCLPYPFIQAAAAHALPMPEHVPAFRPTPRPAQAQDLAHRVLPSCARLRTLSPSSRRCSLTATTFPHSVAPIPSQ
jgi:hypothetical protein